MAAKEAEEEGKKLEGLHVIVSSNLRKHKQRRPFYDISCYDDKWSRRSNCLRFPFPTTAPRLLGSCNGLLCLEFTTTTLYSNGIGNKCVVWEPSTNTLQFIPRPPSMNRPCAASSCSSKRCCLEVMTDDSGLHFDSQSQDYKFFSFTENSYLYRDDVMPICHDISYHAQVYSVKNNAWKELTYPLPKLKGKRKKKAEQEEIVPSGGMGICVNGVCYWDACCGAADFSFILSYSFASEEFSSFHKPKLNENDSAILVELDGSLGLLIYPIVREADWKGVISFMVYSSSSSSWLRVADDSAGFDRVPVVGYHEPVWFGKKNDTYYLLLKGAQGDLIEYDCARKVFNKVYKSKYGPDPDDTCVNVCETKTTKNNANIWHSSSFHQLQIHKRFAVYASECDQGGGDDY